MKKQAGIWIDSSKAIIVTLSGGKENVTEIESKIENGMLHNAEGDRGTFSGSHHINNEKKNEERKKHLVDGFLNKVMEMVKENDELYVFGPSETKLRLKTIIENWPQQSGKLKSVETSDRMTLNQTVAKVKHFYENNTH